MATRPIVFALANPDPEISYAEAQGGAPRRASSPPGAATSRTRSTTCSASRTSSAARSTCAPSEINEAMKIAAARALAELAHEPVPDSGRRGLRRASAFQFGPDYIIPKPFDPRVLWWCAPAVAEAAMESGVARLTLDLDEYRERLQRRIGGTQHTIMRHDRAAGEERAQAHRLPRRRQHQGAARLPDRLDEGIAQPDPARPREEDPPARRRAAISISTGVEIINPRRVAQARRLRRASIWRCAAARA